MCSFSWRWGCEVLHSAGLELLAGVSSRGEERRGEEMAGGGGAAPTPKQDELQPHPVKDQLPNVSYCITSPPPWRESFPRLSCLWKISPVPEEHCFFSHFFCCESCWLMLSGGVVCIVA
ncbi:hypothetical protein BHM03_00039259 [Ensete ventricosum]|nr:hypothetical protein BHM03_00039259 [Ensete ventricosum]